MENTELLFIRMKSKEIDLVINSERKANMERYDANMERYDIENLILGFADIVRENRYLRKENARLQKVEMDYRKSIEDRCRESEQASLNMFKAACVGIAQGKNDMELARDLVEHL